MKNVKKLFLILLTFTLIFTVMPAEQANAATVSASEKAAVKKYIRKNCFYYLAMCCNVGQTPDTFNWDAKRKTDLVIHNICNNLEPTSDPMFEKYHSYGGLFVYSDEAKAAIKKEGTRLFGSSFKTTFCVFSDSYLNFKYFYPLTSDKKYIMMNCPDTGDWTVLNTKYSISAGANGIYTAKVTLATGSFEESPSAYYTYAVKLKKSGSSYVIKSIKLKKLVEV